MTYAVTATAWRWINLAARFMLTVYHAEPNSAMLTAVPCSVLRSFKEAPMEPREVIKAADEFIAQTRERIRALDQYLTVELRKDPAAVPPPEPQPRSADASPKP